METERTYPSIPAIAGTEHSALAFAHQSGLNPIWLDVVSQVITRLAQFGQIVASQELEAPLHELARLQYLEVERCGNGTLAVTLLSQPVQLTSYFWAVWVPHHLLNSRLKVAVTPNLSMAEADTHYCTVVFRIPGSREAAREFLTRLATQYPGCSPEIVAIQAGNALCPGQEVSNA